MSTAEFNTGESTTLTLIHLKQFTKNVIHFNSE